jgi:hypothetical protein
MVLEGAELLGTELRIADHLSVGRDERDARANLVTEGVRFGVEIFAGRAAPV